MIKKLLKKEFKKLTDVVYRRSGIAIGDKIGIGPVKKFNSIDDVTNDNFKEGDVLVTDITDPDWEPIMKKASAIITNKGGRTCHAAIVARELGVVSIVGTIDGTEKLKDNIFSFENS